MSDRLTGCQFKPELDGDLLREAAKNCPFMLEQYPDEIKEILLNYMNGLSTRVTSFFAGQSNKESDNG